MANRKVTDCVYVDFKRAFDIISHQKLLTKLIAYGIDGLLWSGIDHLCLTNFNLYI